MSQKSKKNYKILYVGDPHCTVEDIPDCERLMDYAFDIASKNKAKVCLLGDQYHNHSVINSDVLNFWTRTLERSKVLKVPVIALVGNHDYAGKHSPSHAMVAHKDSCLVVDKPTLIDGILFCPYMSNEDLIDATNSSKPYNTLVCHVSFDGAKFENGFYDPEGLDYSKIPQTDVISGHIHLPQVIGNITYVGAPRWRTLSDASVVNRYLNLNSYDSEGKIADCVKFSTDEICKKIIHLSIVEPEPIPFDVLEKRHEKRIDYRIDIHGSYAWINANKVKLNELKVQFSTFPTQECAIKIKESNGIDVSLFAYLNTFKSKYGTKNEVLEKMITERIYGR